MFDNSELFFLSYRIITKLFKVVITLSLILVTATVLNCKDLLFSLFKIKNYFLLDVNKNKTYFNNRNNFDIWFLEIPFECIKPISNQRMNVHYNNLLLINNNNWFLTDKSVKIGLIFIIAFVFECVLNHFNAFSFVWYSIKNVDSNSV